MKHALKLLLAAWALAGGVGLACADDGSGLGSQQMENIKRNLVTPQSTDVIKMFRGQGDPAFSTLNGLSQVPTTATGGTAARILPDRLADVVNVMDYGAKCDGTDDAAAINAAINAARAIQAADARKSVTLQFPEARFCLIKSTLNFTGHRSAPITPFGNSVFSLTVRGGTIFCQVSAGPCIDALGAIGLTFVDLSLYGDPTITPTIGLQFGVTIAGTTAGHNSMRRVKIWGKFSFTAIYNFGSEVMDYDNLNISLTNSSDAYVVVLDGSNYWNITSAFETETIAQNTVVSLNDQIFRGGSYQTVSANKAAFWINGAGRMRADQIYSSTGAPCNVTYHFASADSYTNNENIWDAHFEPTTAADAFCFEGAIAAPVMKHFRFSTEHASQVSNSIFKIVGTSSITSMQMDDLDVSVVTSPQTVSSPQKLFDDATKWAVSGRVYLSHAAMWTAPASFAGTVCLGDATYKCFSKSLAVNVTALPTCNAAGEGMTAAVNNNNGTTYNAVALNGGTDHVAVQCNGTNWVLH